MNYLLDTLRRMHPLLFIYCLLICSYLFVLPFYMIAVPVVGDAPEFVARQETWVRFAYSVIIGPVFETIIFQFIPIRLIGHPTPARRYTALIVSAILFAAAHDYSTRYMLMTTVEGLLFALGFISRDQQGGRPFLLICTVHVLRNAISYLVRLI